MNLLLIFLTGLTTGGLSCLAMQGGLLAGVIANQKEDELDGSSPKKAKTSGSFDQLDWLPVTIFLASKLVAHTILGFLLGWLGSKLELSLTIRLIFQGIAALFMLGTAFNLLELHPIFRYVVFQPPRFVRKLVKNSTKGKALFTPAVLGFFTILVPCGVTQSMEVLAISSGNPIMGALIMFAFVLGTSPLFALVGVATAKLSETFRDKFMKIAAAALIFLAVGSLNGILVVIDSPITLNKMFSPITYFFSSERFETNNAIPVVNGTQQITINVTNNGYNPRTLRVKNNIPVQLTLQSNETYSCALSFVFKEFGIRTFLDATDTQVFTFTPTKPGKYQFSCSMGMYTGVMEVI
jgi:uncharacterized protein